MYWSNPHPRSLAPPDSSDEMLLQELAPILEAIKQGLSSFHPHYHAMYQIKIIDTISFSQYWYTPTFPPHTFTQGWMSMWSYIHNIYIALHKKIICRFLDGKNVISWLCCPSFLKLRAQLSPPPRQAIFFDRSVLEKFVNMLGYRGVFLPPVGKVNAAFLFWCKKVPCTHSVWQKVFFYGLPEEPPYP